MNGPTKILTVSYGTFSCTLEGFDDPLGSMREMAEYFRDLAADDRYFGAEPPTPDVEMLQRIAEKEVQRRVEARVTATGVALVAAEPETETTEPSEAPDPAAVESVPAPEPSDVDAKPEGSKEEGRDAPLSQGPLAYDDDFLMSDEPEDALFVDPNATVGTSAPAESVAEKLRRIREVVSRNMVMDAEATRHEQAPNAAAPNLRDRALTRTIQQIEADISEDDTSQDDESEEDGPADSASLLAEGLHEGVAAEAPSPDAIAGEDEWGVDTQTPDALEDTSLETATSTSERTVTEMIGSVTDRIKSELSEERDADEADDADPKPSSSLTPQPDADVGRLLNETDSKLNDNETVRRRRVISQMRAAVAATKADRLISNQHSREHMEEAEKDRYREDLSDAVEEDIPSEADASRKTRLLSTPLVLVSSQRIDSEPAPDGGQAMDFAAKFGAKELPELMEAAAAFTIFSEGQNSFTRPEIMKMVSSMDPSLELSREESLRSFGQLLRDGTFKKLERGQFTIDQKTKYNPEARAAGA